MGNELIHADGENDKTYCHLSHFQIMPKKKSQVRI